MLIQLFYVNLVFAFYMSAISAGLNIMTQAFTQNGYPYLGNISILLIFTFGMFGNFICIMYIKKLSFKYSFFIHSLGYLLFLSEGILVCHCSENQNLFCSQTLIWILTVICSAISGFTSSGLFITQNEYISQISTDDQKELYYGIGWAILQLSQIIGSLYSAFLIQPLGQFSFFIFIFSISVICAVCFLLVAEPRKNKIEDQQLINILDSTLNKTISEQFGDLRTIIKTRLAQSLILPMVATGVILSGISCINQQKIQSTLNNQKKHKIASHFQLCSPQEQWNSSEEYFYYQIQITIGIIRKISTAWKQCALFQIFQLALILACINYYLKKYSLNFVIGSLWGFVDCATTSTLLAILAETWKNQVEIFGLFNFLQCVGGLLSTLIIIALEQNQYIWLIIILIIFVTLCKLSITNFLILKHQK